MKMEKLRKIFTCLTLLSATLVIASFLVSCQQSADKQKQAADSVSKTKPNPPDQNGMAAQPGVNPESQKPSGAAPEKEKGYWIKMKGNFSKDPSNQTSRMLNDFAKNSGEAPGPVKKVIMNPDQKKAQELYLSGSKKSTNGDQLGAIADYTQSLNLYKMPGAYMKRGFAELISEDYASTINDMTEAIKMNPNLFRAYFGRGVARFQLQDFKSAEEDLTKFTENDKTTAMAYNYIAGCRFMEQDYTGALENYEKVEKLDPKYPDVYTNRGMMKHYLNDLKGAVADYDKALSIDPDNATAYNNRGGAKLNQQDFKGALEDFNKAISLKKDYADAYDNRAKAKINLGDNAGACQDWQQALNLGFEASKELIDKYCK